MMQCHCVGCGFPDPTGPFCTQCWGRLPESIRLRISAWRAQAVHSTAQHQAAIDEGVRTLRGERPAGGHRGR